MTASTQLDIPQSLRDQVRERVLSALVGFFSEEQLDTMIMAEINAFFTTDTLLTVQETRVNVDNPHYGQNGDWQRTKERSSLAFGSKMTPFRQMVWSIMHQHLTPVFQKALETEGTAVQVAFSKWVGDLMVPDMKATEQTLFQQTAMMMAMSMFATSMRDAVTKSHVNMTASFMSMGLDVSRIPPLPDKPF